MSDNDEASPPPETELPEGIGDAADGKRIRKRRERVQDEALAGAAFWRAALNDPVGRREIWSLLISCHTFEERFACGPTGYPQPEASWFQAGERETGLRLYRSLLRIDHELVSQMHHEHDAAFASSKPKRRGGAVT